MDTPSEPPAKEIPPPEVQLEYGEEVLCAGWNPDIEQLAKARERQLESSAKQRKRR